MNIHKKIQIVKLWYQSNFSLSLLLDLFRSWWEFMPLWTATKFLIQNFSFSNSISSISSGESPSTLSKQSKIWNLRYLWGSLLCHFMTLFNKMFHYPASFPILFYVGLVVPTTGFPFYGRPYSLLSTVQAFRCIHNVGGIAVHDLP